MKEIVIIIKIAISATKPLLALMNAICDPSIITNLVANNLVLSSGERHQFDQKQLLNAKK